MTADTIIPKLLIVAWLLPLAGFAIEVFGRYWQSGRRSKAAAGLAIACIGIGFVLSAAALAIGIDWDSLGEHHGGGGATHAAAGHDGADPVGHGVSGDKTAQAHTAAASDSSSGGSLLPLSGTIYTLARFGRLELSIDYYIDSLTLVMFTMVTLVALCIHVFAVGYMSDELTDDRVDHLVPLSDGRHLHRPGRFHLFFAYFSLFSFSMLGLVLSGNVFMVFVFWELVGICSYLLIGFYVERHSASTAANKAFIVNRVGDFGFIIGLMIIWSAFGTFRFGNTQPADGGPPRPGLFQMVRGSAGQPHAGRLDREDDIVYLRDIDGHRLAEKPNGESPATVPYWMLVALGLGIFAGCVGKSAQFPLQTWLPDAMEGPTPVSALVHSATMVAAGVYLAGRFYPMFTSEVLLVIAYIGCITLFLAATIAVVATDIKRVLAYSTISQLGYMMLGIGVAGWAAGLFHLITHAFFKSLMFLASGSVIVACHHEQDMSRMGGLLKKMPITALTFLVGVIAISGLAIPGVIAFSGYYSKDA
ncbi:MAG TPA: NADH-quinone oxidoreductase subunit L, partial [Planctomycetaceae bacterium]|nr:NADH-quinone oxidoreductase subunit L [Planctomycetaceae bacterium]